MKNYVSCEQSEGKGLHDINPMLYKGLLNYLVHQEQNVKKNSGRIHYKFHPLGYNYKKIIGKIYLK